MKICGDTMLLINNFNLPVGKVKMNCSVDWYPKCYQNELKSIPKISKDFLIR